MPQPQPFRLHVPDETMRDLGERLARVRWPDEPPGPAWATGSSVAYMQSLVAYWRDGFDWRAQEAAINSFRQFKAPLGGIDLHFIHEEGTGPNPAPLLLSHGWPGSIVEFLKILPMLTDPARFGADPADAFTVVAPSLPGYALSFAPGQKRFGVEAISRAVRRPDDRRFGLSPLRRAGRRLGRLHHLAARLPVSRAPHRHPSQFPARPPRPENAGKSDAAEEKAYLDQLNHWLKEETGYSSIQGTKPTTLAFGLTDSPAGLAAWIVEKFRAWTDCGGNVETAVSRDEMLTDIMLYWATGAIGSSFWPYYDRVHSGWPIPEGAADRDADRLRRVSQRDFAPAALAGGAHLRQYPALDRDGERRPFRRPGAARGFGAGDPGVLQAVAVEGGGAWVEGFLSSGLCRNNDPTIARKAGAWRKSGSPSARRPPGSSPAFSCFSSTSCCRWRKSSASCRLSRGFCSPSRPACSSGKPLAISKSSAERANPHGQANAPPMTSCSTSCGRAARRRKSIGDG